MERRMGVVTLLASALALVVGLVLGGIGPRAEVRGLRATVAELEAGPCNQTGREIASIFRGRPWEADHPEAFEPAPERASEPALPPPDKDGKRRTTGEEGFRVTINGEGDAQSEDPDGGWDPERADLARDALELRRTQARAALIEDARADSSQVAHIDAAVGRMNEDLRVLATEFVETVGAGEEPTRREMMSFAADTLDVLIEAEDQITGTLDEDQLEAVKDEAVDPLSHIDPSLVDLFLELDQ